VTVVQTNVDRTGTNPQLIGALDGVDGFDIPQDVLDFNAGQRGDSTVNAIDRGFEVPSQYRWNLGVKHTLPWEIELTADWIYSRVKEEVLWKDLRLEQVGTAPDGRPIFGPKDDGRSSPFIQDLLLTNTGKGEGTVLSLEFSKTWRLASGRFDAYLGYANEDVSDVNPGTSSTASSNWDNVATSDPNDPGLATSNYEMRHRFNGSLGWRKAFFGDYETSLALVAEHRSGSTVQLHVQQRDAGRRLGRPAPGRIRAPAPAFLRAGRRCHLRSALYAGGDRRRRTGLRGHGLFVRQCGCSGFRCGHGRVHPGTGARKMARAHRAAQFALESLGLAAGPAHGAGAPDLPQVARHRDLRHRELREPPEQRLGAAPAGELPVRRAGRGR
jgi:hypothetical protein